MRKLLAKIRKILKDRRTRQLLTRTVSVAAAIVVFVTTYALVLRKRQIVVVCFENPVFDRIN